MALLTTQDIVDAGTAPTLVAASASDTCDVGNGRNVFAVYKNTNGVARNVTVVVPGNTTYGQLMPDPIINLPLTTGEKWIPLRLEYRDPVTGLATLTLDATPGVTVAIVRMS